METRAEQIGEGENKKRLRFRLASQSGGLVGGGQRPVLAARRGQCK